MIPRLLLLGESPPPGSPPDFSPFDCQSGSRLARALGLRDRRPLLAHVERANVFDVPTGPRGCPPWEATRAEENARRIIAAQPPRSVVVCLGRKVAEAAGLPSVLGLAPPPGAAWSIGAVELVHLPHPSGSSPALDNRETARDIRRALLPELVSYALDLRPWHFAIDSDFPSGQDAFVDLGVAVCPTSPGLGMALLASINGISQGPLLARERVGGAHDVSLLSLRTWLAEDQQARELIARLGLKPANVKSAAKAHGELVAAADGAYRRHCRERAASRARSLAT
jgi:hypothetical protein